MSKQKVISTSSKQNIETQRKNKVLTVIGTGIFVILCLTIFFPVFAGIIASFRPGRELVRYGLSVNLDFATMTLDNYKYLFTGQHAYFTWFKNSLFLLVITVVLTVFICYLVAYGLTMYEFKLKNLLFFLVISTMMVPFEILMLPLYNQMIDMNLIDTTAGVILPGLVSASTVFFFRQYMLGLPKELLDSGRIDGASEYGICIRIVMPIAKPAFAAMSILAAMGSWNNLLWPMLVYRSAEKFTLPIGLNTLMTPYGNNYDLLIAGAMFSILPVFIIFLIFKEYFVEGMTAGAIKG